MVILDRHLPDADGLEVARRVRQLLPAVKVLFFSADGDLEGVNAALRAGAMGYVLKTGGDEDLRLAIRFVTSGRLLVGPEVNACLLERYRQILTGQEAGAEHRLTGREREFLRLVAEGLRSKEIADRLQITPKSADTYRSRLMKKLGCGSTAELVRFALREGLAP